MINVILKILELKEHATDLADKWKYDPHLNEAHQDYLSKIESIIDEMEKAV